MSGLLAAASSASTSLTSVLLLHICWIAGASAASTSDISSEALIHTDHNWLSLLRSQQQDLIGRPSPAVTYVHQRAVHALFFGDSNDRNIVNDFCTKAEPRPPQHEVETLRDCWHGNLTLTWQPMIGVSPFGPYWQNLHGTPRDRLKHGLQEHLRMFQSPPDLVTLSSSLWDLWHWASSAPELLDGKQIEANVLQSWQADLSGLLSHIEVSNLASTL